MQAAFTDLVRTAIMPAHCFDSTEFRDLAPALDTNTAIHDNAAHASETQPSFLVGPPHGPCAVAERLNAMTLEG